MPIRNPLQNKTERNVRAGARKVVCKAVWPLCAAAWLSLSAAAAAQSVSLQEATQAASVHSPSVVQAEQSLASAKAALAASRDALDPKATLSAAAGGGSLSPNGTTLPRVVGTESLSADLTVPVGVAGQLQGSAAAGGGTDLSLSGRWQLWPSARYDKTTLSIESARQSVVEAEASLKMAQVQATIAIAHDYRAAQIAAARAEVAAAADAAAADALGRTKTALQAGSATESDLLDAQAKAAQATYQARSARSSADQALAALAHQLGMDDQKLELPPWASAEFNAYTPDEAKLRARLESSDPTLLAAKDRVAAAEAQLASTKANGGLNVALNGQLSLPHEADGVHWNVGVGATLPLYDGGSHQHAVEQAQLSLASAQRALGESRTSLLSALSSQIDGLEQKALQITALGYTRDKTALVAKQSELQRAQGLLTDADLLTRRQAARSAQLDWDQAVVDYDQQAAALGAYPGEAIK